MRARYGWVGGGFKLLIFCKSTVLTKTQLPSVHFHYTFIFLSVTSSFLSFPPTVCADEPPGEDDSTEPPTTQMITADSELIAEQDSNLTINCNHEHNGTVYQVTLEKMPHMQPWVIIGICEKALDQVPKDYNDRGRVSCTDTLHVSLHLTGVVEEDGGFYRCTFNTDAGLQTTTVLVSVLPPGTKTRLNAVIGLKPGGRIPPKCFLWQSVVTDVMCKIKQCCGDNLQQFRGLHLQNPQHPVTLLKTIFLEGLCAGVNVCLFMWIMSQQRVWISKYAI